MHWPRFVLGERRRRLDLGSLRALRYLGYYNFLFSAQSLSTFLRPLDTMCNGKGYDSSKNIATTSWLFSSALVSATLALPASEACDKLLLRKVGKQSNEQVTGAAHECSVCR